MRLVPLPHRLGVLPPAASSPDVAAGGASLLSSCDACGLTCAARETSSCVCAVDCAVSHAFDVAPEGSLNATWQGSTFTETALPAGCFHDTTCFDMCLVEGAPGGQLAS